MESTISEKKFRENVAAVIVNDAGLILTCRRADAFKNWQLPQGGIDEGESPREALLRELSEEIGTNDVRIIGTLPEPIRYDWPERLWPRGFHGQEQYYFLVQLNPTATIDLAADSHQEFDECKWIEVACFLKDVDCIPAPAYRIGIPQLEELFPGHIKR